ncbi:MAG TPA: hypothetical protein VMP08_00335 [Anaerolineae bacterium]|nr:hypothetical protein [Anaerolineae bacterium]
MTNIHTEQLLRVLLSQAHAGREAERDQRLRAEQRATQARVLQFEMAQRLIPKELDDLWKTTDVNLMPDDQFMRWMISKLHAQLFDYWAIRSGRVADQMVQLQKALRERDETLRRYEGQITEQSQSSREIVALKDRVGQLQTELDQAAQDKEEMLADLATSRAMVQHLQTQVEQSSVTTDHTIETAVVASPMTAVSDWYQAWLAETSPENVERQKVALKLIGRGEVFFRSEIVERLKAQGLLNDVSVDKPSGTATRLLADLSTLDFVTEINAGYGAAVPKPLQLTERGREAYRLLWGDTIEESPFDRLLKRHKTIEHTALNLLSYTLLQRFGFQAIELYPAPLHTTAGAVVDPDLVAVSPAGERLIIECERMVMHRTPAERDAKWNHLAEVTRGQLYVVVLGNRQQSDLMTELSAWIQASQTKKVSLAVCQYLKAIRPEAPTMWTYTTTWAIA